MTHVNLDGWTCPVCRGTRRIQPDRWSPPELCPRCVDEDAADERAENDMKIPIDLLALEAAMCGNCHGHGHISNGDDDYERYDRCHICGGTGFAKTDNDAR